MEDSHFKREDRDLLVEIKTQMTYVVSEIKAMKDDTAVSIKDHELRIRKLESWGAMAIGALFILQILAAFLFKK